MAEAPRQKLARAELTGQEARCLAMQHYDGLTQQAIAERLNLSQATVSRHIATARQKLGRAGLKLRSLTMSPGPVMSLGRDVSAAEITARW